jgi:hypothetical protein
MIRVYQGGVWKEWTVEDICDELQLSDLLQTPEQERQSDNRLRENTAGIIPQV